MFEKNLKIKMKKYCSVDTPFDIIRPIEDGCDVSNDIVFGVCINVSGP